MRCNAFDRSHLTFDRNLSTMREDRILINVRGVLYETSRATLERFPNTLLGRHAKKLGGQECINENISLQCRAETFDAILFYYQSNGILARPTFISPEEFLRACEHFEIDQDEVNKLKEKDGVFLEEGELEIYFQNSIQEMIYNIVESREPKLSSLIYIFLSSMMVFASIILACMITMPSIRQSRVKQLYKDPYFLTELVLNALFSIEYVLRLFASPEKRRFFISALNIIDLIAFLPFFIILLIDSSKIYDVTLLKIVRIIRIVRLLRLAVRNNTMATVVHILNNCMLDIMTMCMYILLTSVFWASVIYYAEMTVPLTQFKSIPDAMWWAIQTVLPIGYGDILPISIQGKLIGSAVAVLAAFTLTVPLLSLGGKLLNLYSQKFHVDIGPDLKSSEPKELRGIQFE
eukprot:Seg413.5 transcript_id=Seg413.5/GoldUCD/mRNA.D3Y31 product="Potassium voltage-gated channel subfamily A member 4" protein_id=Seg413.5/GoldUCD/D3Y31